MFSLTLLPAFVFSQPCGETDQRNRQACIRSPAAEEGVRREGPCPDAARVWVWCGHGKVVAGLAEPSGGASTELRLCRAVLGLRGHNQASMGDNHQGGDG